MKAQLLVIGEELLAGDIVDKNTAYLSIELAALGIEVREARIIGDVQSEIVEALNYAVGKSELVITTGGLGPTEDDLTRDAICKLAAVEPVLNKESEERLAKYYKSRGRPFNPGSKRQVYFPAGAEVIQNPVGTADAFITRVNDVPIITLPGVPREIKGIYDVHLKDWLKTNFRVSTPVNKSFLTVFGLSESHVGGVIEGCKLPKEVKVGYRPRFPEVYLKFSATNSGLLADAVKRVREAIGEEFIVASSKDASLKNSIGEIIKESGKSVAFAESCTGGRVADYLVNNEGASEYFLSSIVTYSNASKEKLLGVPKELLETYGAVSKEVALAMAKGARERTGADIAVSITGIAGPNGGSKEKPIGTVCFAISTKSGEQAVKDMSPFGRNFFRTYCAFRALDLVRREVLGLPFQWDKR